MAVEKLCQKPITFYYEEGSKVASPYLDPSVIFKRTNKFFVKRILINTGSSVNLTTVDLYEKLGLQKKNLAKVPYPLVGLCDKVILVLGVINPSVMIGNE